tara:strand:- start:922 stop:1338 length:417 start_codon:yes stop_codon:yes gene_type:complete
MITTREQSFKTKAKGESLQLKVRDQLRNFVADPDLIQSQKMSAHGEDIIIDPKLRKDMPYSFECMYSSKPVTSTDLMKKMKQAKRQNNDLALAIKTIPAVIFEIEGSEPIIMIPYNDFSEDRFGKNIVANEEQENEVH